jgi:polyketide-type polyunsaturated fatty acid synthase PfaA
MSSIFINAAIAQLEDQINNCEKDLLRFIEGKKMKSENPMSIQKINRQLQHNPIAIIGMASLFPQARNLREYWENIVNKIDCITDVPSTHWNVEDYYDPNPRNSNEKTYCKRGGFIPHVDFNPMEFGIPPNILEVTDVSQLLSLVVAKEAMEDAGYGESREFNRDNTGVVLGVAMSKQLATPLSARLEYPIWEKVLKSSGLSDEDTKIIVDKIKSAYVKWDENAFPGMLANVIAGRIANRLNFGGMNCVVDAACASSLGALKLAISELIEHRADMMMTGGVDTDNTIMAYMCFSKTPAVTPSDNVKPFDAKSDGMMLGEGIGMVLLKRLEDAERDKDKIYAVIKGIGTSSDGRYKSIYAPRKEGQVKALERAYEDAGFAPQSVGLIEAHGTGTMAGDPTEFGSLKDFFGVNERKQHIALGTVKSQIGHTKAAAGAASLIKTALALHHKILPPTINITEPNPKLNIKNSSFYLNTETRPWIRAEGETPRRAGVSSFGFGGTNYHVVLEEYEAEHDRPYRLHNTPQTVLLFAQTPAQLLAQCQEVLGKLQASDADKNFALLVENCKSQEVPLNAARVGFVAESLEEACKFLLHSIDLLKNKPTATNWEHPQGIFYRSSGMKLGGKVVALFSGQGSQYLDMGRELVMNFPSMRRMYGYMDSLLLKDNLQPLSEIVFPHPVFEEAEKNAQIAALQRTEYAQPAIGMFSAGLYKILQQAGLKADFVAGHSFGELTALWAAGVLSEEDYCFLVKARGQAMAAPKDPNYDVGTMLAVKEDLSKVEAVLKNFPQVSIANFNSPRQVVLAGPTTEIAKVRQAMHELGYAAVSLPVSAAFHTPLIAFAQKSFAIASKSVSFHDPKIPIYTNVTGNLYPKEPVAIQKILETHLSKSVLFKQEIENIYGAGGYCFIEFGPRRILTNLVKDILGDRPHLAIALNPSSQKNCDRSLREAVVQLRVAGLTLQNLDPYELPSSPITDKSKGLSISINGINYVSEKTKNAFAQSLQDGHQVTIKGSSVTPSTNGHNKNLTSSGRDVKDEEIIQQIQNPVINTPPSLNSSQPVLESNMQTPPEKNVNHLRVLESLEYVLTQFQQNQSENLQVHGTYLNHQMEYAKTFFQLMQQQNALLCNHEYSTEAAKLKPVVAEGLERSMMQFHNQQGETLRIHDVYLKDQVEYTKNFFQLIQQQYSQLIVGGLTAQVPVNTERVTVTPPKENPLIVETTPVLPTAKISESLPEPIVKNASTAIEVAPPVPKIQETQPAPIFEERIFEPVALVVAVITKPEPAPTANVDVADMGNNLLAIISEKTGYPVEMLELDMDMEADLGIDSIKRVEILGALQEMYPDLPKPNVEEISEKRTIGEIVGYLESQASLTMSVEIALSEVKSHSEIQPIAEQLVTEEVIEAVDTSNIAQTLLTITSEKTGYPVEMLELDMDMEADLGIDSIKRVEILGALQDLFPDMPKPNVEELGELRTIAQIVDYLQGLLGGEKKKSQPKSGKQLDLDSNIVRRPVNLKILPKPDCLDFTLPEGHIGLITDDGSLTTTKLAHKLLGLGWKVVVLSFPQSLVPQRAPLPPGVSQIKLVDLSEEHLQEQLAGIAFNHGAVGAFIHINPVFEVSVNGKIPYLEQEKAIVKHIFLIAKHLKKSLNEAANKGRSCFCTIARIDGAFGLAGNIHFGPITAGLFGLTKTLNWEWQKVFCRAVDLHPNLDAEQSANYIIAELQDPNLYITEVAYGSQGRATLISIAQS